MNVSCPHCSTQLTATEKHIGLKVKCQKCQENFVVQAPEPAPVSQESHPADKISIQVRDANKNQLGQEPQTAPPTPHEIVQDRQSTSPAINSASKQPFNRVGYGVVEGRSWFDLFDPSFRTFMTPKLVRLLFIISYVVLAILLIVNSVFLVLVLMGAAQASLSFTELLFAVAIPMLYYAYIGLWFVLWRLFFEAILIHFRKFELLHTLASKE